ncbi:transposase [Pseudomonas sp. PS1(2021)]|uniref:IS66-like element accessory protein TnpA n=1 Tax=Pseudomonas sp. PS1(2021) TaxID=2866282 RepID=UPI001CEFD403|nr:transposase [Pseudomonas sp. PS1(2021)]
MVSTCFWWTPFQAPCGGSPVPGQRRSYPKSFKAQVVDECTQPGASVAGVALSHGLNANLVHKWIRRQQAQLPAVPSGFIPFSRPERAGYPECGRQGHPDRNSPSGRQTVGAVAGQGP